MTQNNLSQAAAVPIGWRPEEIEMLRREADKALKENAPLKRVFEKIAEQTGRKPNSIRNYYYAKMKGGESSGVIGKGNALKKEAGSSLIKKREVQAGEIRFIPFTDEEIRELIVTMLEAQAQGMSVRGCALKMGNGDKSQMLRYQNKYRSILKSHRDLVEKVMDELNQQRKMYFNPYTKEVVGRGAGGKVSIIRAEASQGDNKETVQPEKTEVDMDTESGNAAGAQPEQKEVNFIDIISGIIQDMESIQNADMLGLFKNLHALTRMAARQMYSRKKADEYDKLTVKYDLLLIEAEKMEKEIQEGREREAQLKEMLDERDKTIREMEAEITALHARIDNQMDDQRDKTNRLLNLSRQLIDLNRRFLGLNSVNKVSSLNHYTYELAECMREYEKVLNEYV